ncbi:hypothetical protein BCR33DRAFT_762230 [Rhizoclosmatium globosum]|uniref:Phytocyanin domain-containing protein n=1 Tax=Rhizoclosmatium globosum TaxID=329046 RepID=A0A1Y2CX13_9FUNG|nr:hypothetical protein BCR33DRAFT_762230 [Rhizoclosmatium globosum]|eukprot:ORY51517.1 hypothetical protein BCR33DRAFT_762230 [Rhizoclosmatium globosum]
MNALFVALAAASAVNAATYNIIAASGAGAPFQNVPASAVVGDVLAFDLGGNHAVVDVTAAQYDSCSVDPSTPPLLGLTSNGLPTPGFSYTLTTPGTYYIVCPVGNGNHCKAGMKFALTVSAGTAPAQTTAAAPVATSAVAAAATTTASAAAKTTAAAAVATSAPATTTKSSASISAFALASLSVLALFL